MTDLRPATRRERAIAYLARHRNAERIALVALGALSFCVFILPVLEGSAWAFDQGYHFPYFGPDWMYLPNVAMRMVLLFGPSLVGMALFYRFIHRVLGKPVMQLREGGATP